jgi:glutamine amidotransferase
VIGIINYGMGNLGSVRNAFEHLGFDADICSQPERADEFDRLVLPGVGSFRSGMESLDGLRWTAILKSCVSSGRPLLGICLGMQLLFDRGDEHGPTRGLGLIRGEVVKLTPCVPNKVPHVGWNNLNSIKAHPLFEGVKPNIDFYFVHSYHCVPIDPSDTIATCDFGGEFVAGVAHGNVVGVQFHPEKSQPAGMRILENFAQWHRGC